MAIPKYNGPDHGNSSAMEEGASARESHDTANILFGARGNETMMVATTVGIVAVGAALFEVALLPGIAIGVAAMLAPKYVPGGAGGGTLGPSRNVSFHVFRACIFRKPS
jgi:hypothetical protein